MLVCPEKWKKRVGKIRERALRQLIKLFDSFRGNLKFQAQRSFHRNLLIAEIFIVENLGVFAFLKL